MVSTGFTVIDVDERQADADYIYFFLSQKSVVETLHAIAEQSTSAYPSIKASDIENVEINLPPIYIQRKISSLLNIITDKMVQNTAINDNLQQQMQTIFLYTFPNVFTEIGGTVGELLSFSNGKKRPGDEGNIPVYGGNGILAYTNVSNNKNCIIIGRVGAYCGNLYYSSQSCWISDNAISAKSKVGNSQLFSYYLLKNASLSSRHIGTSQPLLTQGILNAIPCKIPKVSEINEFNDVCTPLQAMVDANVTENIQLTCLRDSILPKLMSGEIDVSAANV